MLKKYILVSIILVPVLLSCDFAPNKKSLFNKDPILLDQVLNG